MRGFQGARLSFYSTTMDRIPKSALIWGDRLEEREVRATRGIRAAGPLKPTSATEEDDMQGPPVGDYRVNTHNRENEQGGLPGGVGPSVMARDQARARGQEM